MHPELVNNSFPSHGSTAIHYAARYFSESLNMAMILSSKARLGVCFNRAGECPLAIALKLGRRQAVLTLLEMYATRLLASADTSVLFVPAAISFWSNGIELASQYPAAFLACVKAMNLSQANETLSKHDTSCLVLQRRVLRGSDLRSPKDIWDGVIHRLEKLDDAGI